MRSGYKALTFRKVNSILLSASRLRRGLDIAVAVAPVVVAAAAVVVVVVVAVVVAHDTCMTTCMNHEATA